MMRRRFEDSATKEETTPLQDDSKYSKTKSKNHRKQQSLMSCVLKFTVVAVVALVIFFGIVCPVVFRASLFIRKGLLFMNWLNLPLFRNLSNPELEFGLNCTQHFYIVSEKEDIRLGVWHILPKSRISECDLNDPERLSNAFDDDRQVILYLHGNGGARGGNHRKELYKVLAYHASLDYHVIAVDYRGYGDSSQVDPTSSGLVDDAATVYDWLLNKVNRRKERITIWGHSLGTAVATYLISKMDPYSQPSSLILEAPFSSIHDALSFHPLSSWFKVHPYFNYYFVDPMVNNDDTNFDSAAKIRHVYCNLMILHAYDDVIVPYPLGEKLHRIALESRSKTAPAAQLVSFDGSKGYGHKGIFKDADLPSIIKEFVDKSRKWATRPQEDKRKKEAHSPNDQSKGNKRH
jgi:abhydrolase domain-containing protein 12